MVFLTFLLIAVSVFVCVFPFFLVLLGPHRMGESGVELIRPAVCLLNSKCDVLITILKSKSDIHIFPYLFDLDLSHFCGSFQNRIGDLYILCLFTKFYVIIQFLKKFYHKVQHEVCKIQERRGRGELNNNFGYVLSMQEKKYSIYCDIVIHAMYFIMIFSFPMITFRIRNCYVRSILRRVLFVYVFTWASSVNVLTNWARI